MDGRAGAVGLQGEEKKWKLDSQVFLSYFKHLPAPDMTTQVLKRGWVVPFFSLKLIVSVQELVDGARRKHNL